MARNKGRQALAAACAATMVGAGLLVTAQFQLNEGEVMFRDALDGLAAEQTPAVWGYHFTRLQEKSPERAWHLAVLYWWLIDDDAILEQLFTQPGARQGGGYGGGRGGVPVPSGGRPLALGPPRFTGGGAVEIQAAWLPEYPLPGSALDRFGSTNLSNPKWVHLGTQALTPPEVAAAAAALPVDLSGRGPGWAGRGFFAAASLVDSDGDGLSDAWEELITKSNPDAYSSAGDLFSDGWKASLGLDPNAYLNPGGDIDGDGLTALDEYRYCTNPYLADTDGDGIPDGVEVAQGSCPNDADDNGDPANCVRLKLTVGDPSGSASERWEMHVTDAATGKMAVRHCDTYFGTPGSAEYALVKGKTYAFELKWVATLLWSQPDYDWCCLINDSAAAGAYKGLHGSGTFLVEDPDHLLTPETDGDDVNITLGRKGKIIVPAGGELAFTFLTPGGDPAVEPSENIGFGQNQFTYTSEAVGKIRIILIAQVQPPEASKLIAAKCQFKVGAIGSASQEWLFPCVDGIAAGERDGLLTATAEFIGLPYHNDDFGTKMAELWYDGTLVASNKYQVFYPKNAANRPGVLVYINGDVPTDPNWFYYNKEGGVCGISQNCVYDPNANYLGMADVTNSVIYLGPSAARHSPPPGKRYTFTSANPFYGSIIAGGNGTGIVFTAEIIQHEWTHINNYYLSKGLIDLDGDHIADILEWGLMGIMTSPNDPDTYRTFSLFPDQLYYKTHGDDEIRARISETNLTFQIHFDKDWANPGYQHKNWYEPW